MEKSKHTPGPWEAQWSTRALGGITLGWHVLARPHAVEEPIICEIPDGRLDGAEEANARLIAAAPETAAERDRLKVENAELREALKAIAEGAGPYSRDPLKHAEGVIESQRKIAREALAKTSEESDEQYRKRRMEEEGITEQDIADTMYDEPKYK